MIGVPKLTPETFKKFGRNSYLVKVANQSQGYMLQGATKNYGDSGILSVKPYDDFNGCKGKIYNSDLAKLPIEKLLDRCPQNVVDAYNIKTFDRTTKTLINSSAIILKFSNSVPPDQLTIGPYRLKVKQYTAFPRTCGKCLEYGHSKKVCKNKDTLCSKCSIQHMDMNTEEPCNNQMKCHHCLGNHRTFNKDCPEFQKQKEISNIAYNEKTSIKEAKMIYNRNNSSGQTYANTVKTQSQINSKSLSQNKPDQSVRPKERSISHTSGFWNSTPQNKSPYTSIRHSTSKIGTPISTAVGLSNSPTNSLSTGLNPELSSPTIIEDTTTTTVGKTSTTSARSCISSAAESFSSSEPNKSKKNKTFKDPKKPKLVKSPSLPDLDQIDTDDLLIPGFQTPKGTKSNKIQDNSVPTKNRYSLLSVESLDETKATNTDSKMERKRKSLDVSKDNEHSSSQPPNKESKTDVLRRSSSKSKKGKSLDNTPDMKTLNKSIIIGGKHLSKLPDSKCKSGSLTTKGPLEKHSKS